MKTITALISREIDAIIGIDEIALSPNGAHVKDGKLSRNKLRAQQRKRKESRGW